jgi:hypothetical protein
MVMARASTRSVRASLPAAGLVLASTGRAFSAAAIDLTVARAREESVRVRVVTVARIHGSSFGLQHPGLMPSKKEKDAAQRVVTDAIRALQDKGLKADGEVVITRNPGRAVASVARAARGARHVVIDEASGGRLSRWSAGLTGRAVRFRAKVPVTVLSGGIVHHPGTRAPVRSGRVAVRAGAGGRTRNAARGPSPPWPGRPRPRRSGSWRARPRAGL